MNDQPDTVEISPAGEPAGSVIWLHGLGADGHDFEPVVAELRLPAELSLRFVFPHAPVRPVTINGGMSMRAWYDILTFDRSGAQDETGIRASAALLESLIERETKRGVAPQDIVLAGFSQGGAIAIHTALRYPRRLAGLLALSTWLPLEGSLQAEVRDNAQAQPREMPVFLAHGLSDPILPPELGRRSRELITGLGFDVEWHEYPMAHAVCAEEIVAIRSWLLRVYGAG